MSKRSRAPPERLGDDKTWLKARKWKTALLVAEQEQEEAPAPVAQPLAHAKDAKKGPVRCEHSSSDCPKLGPGWIREKRGSASCRWVSPAGLHYSSFKLARRSRCARDSWVACDTCGKWRRWSGSGDVPSAWSCELNEDDSFNSCDILEEPWKEADEIPDDEDDGGTIAGSGKRQRCGECSECTAPNCGECSSCLDMSAAQRVEPTL